MTRVVVVGAGISGLSAAYRLAAEPGYEVIVLEGSDRIGGKLRTAAVAGVQVDVGAEAMLNRRPEGVALARELGLEIVHPTKAGSRIYSRGRLRPMPRSLMGVPMDLDGLRASGLLSDAGLAAVEAERGLGPEIVDGDISVGELLARRCGPEVVDQLTEPLLGGVYAGHAHRISAAAAVPQLLEFVRRGSLVEQATALPTSQVPVFAGLAGGMGQLPERLVERGAFTVRRNTPVRSLRRVATGFVVEIGAASSGADAVRSAVPGDDAAAGLPVSETITADRVVLATPAAPTARLLAELAPGASGLLAECETASVVVVTFAFRAADLAGLAALDGSVSGFLVPPSEKSRIKASTFSFGKWAWVRDAGRSTDGGDVVHLRTSLGRHGDAVGLQAADDELVAWSLADLADATGLRARPLDVHVQRWGGGLPQYAVGHRDRVAAIREAVAEVSGLAVCGALYDGVGIPACIASAERAVTQLLATPPR
ncbi:protoporphyrinogen oxidase [Nocardioides sp. Bht2]|uniref:protoporphyrinogen oxidase n=1 Tax=Nocardioides sp. Bht2 TaxID=3392297 RepID=UPI0039B5BD37